jgi:hypothetical protein
MCEKRKNMKMRNKKEKERRIPKNRERSGKD